MMPPRKGELREELVLPESIFSAEDIKSRRESCYQRGVRSRLVHYPETDDRHGYYKLTLIGPAHEMKFATLMFSFFDNSGVKLRK